MLLLHVLGTARSLELAEELRRLDLLSFYCVKLIFFRFFFALLVPK